MRQNQLVPNPLVTNQRLCFAVPRPPIRIQLNEVEENTIEVTWNAVTGAKNF